MNKIKEHTKMSSGDLTKGSIVKGIFAFVMPVFLGQLLQQLYNMADAWVVGNFADHNAFAAVSSAGNIVFLIIGFFNGIGIGGGVVISRYFGAKDEKYVEMAVHTNFLFGIGASILSTIVGLALVPSILRWMNTPESVLPYSLTYFRIYFAGVSTIIIFNICMSIMRALGDSLHPLYYLILSSGVNIVLDILFVAILGYGVTGAAVATVLSQGLSAVLCLIRLCRQNEYVKLDFKKLCFHKKLFVEVIRQGLPSGVQNSVISIGNLVIQTSINSFGAFAMSGIGAYSRIEGIVFLPIMSISMAIPTFISQNIGAHEFERAKRGAAISIISGMVIAEVIGVLLLLFSNQALRLFIDVPEALHYGNMHVKVVSLFYCLLAFSHCTAGVLRGSGKSIVPMLTMLICWCGVRIVYVPNALQIINEFQMISVVYPITWTLSSIVFLISLIKSDWTHTSL